jgi:paraquat-inducible protein B
LLSWIAAGGFAATSACADIYSWEDSAGVIHYSNQEAPPEAALYMRETAPPVAAEPIETKDENNNDAVAKATAHQQAEAQAQIEAVNRKLDRALEKVDDLTETVARSREQAEAAAEAARQAEREAAATSSDQSDIQEPVIVYTVPYHRYGHDRYRHINQGKNHRVQMVTRPRSRSLNPETRLKPYTYRANSRIGKITGRRHKPDKYQIPGPILPPEPYHIPAAYGVR